MATPVIQSRAESTQVTGTTTHTVTAPSGLAVGDIWLMYIGTSVACTFTDRAGYPEVVDTGVITGGEKIIWRVVDGTEGASQNFTSSATTKSSHLSWRISGADTATTPALSTVATGTSNSPDPTTVSPGSTADWLYIAAFNMPDIEADDDTWCNSAPSGYGNLIQITSGTSGTAAQNAVVAGADLPSTSTSSEDPGAFNIDHNSVSWRAYAIAVGPPTGGATPGPVLPRRQHSGKLVDVRGWD